MGGTQNIGVHMAKAMKVALTIIAQGIRKLSPWFMIGPDLLSIISPPTY
jgi:hypothetical protein